MSRFDAKLTILRYVARHSEYFAAKFHGQPRRDQRPAVLLSLHNDDASRHPGDNAVPDREIFGCRLAANGKLADDGAAFQYLLIELLVF